MADSDRLATELSALRTTLRVRPPGVEAVVQTVARRRRRRRIAVVVTAFVALAAISTAAFGLPTAPERPDVSTSQSPSPAPSLSPSTTPTGSVAGSPSTAKTESAGNPEFSGCRPTGLGGLNGHDNYLADVDLNVVVEALCPNERVEASWATYSVDAFGVQHLEGSQTVILDAATPIVNVSVVLPQACTYWVYFLQNANIPATIPANANLVDSIPFRRYPSLAPSGIFTSFTGSNCGSMPTVPPH
ncbi:MAG: hypothetical protein ACM30G_09835 [Micromonosporaceae bacterium]